MVILKCTVVVLIITYTVCLWTTEFTHVSKGPYTYRLNLLLLVFSNFFSSTFFLDMHIAGYYAIIGIKVETIVTFLTKILLKYKSTDTFKYKMVLKVIT